MGVPFGVAVDYRAAESVAAPGTASAAPVADASASAVEHFGFADDVVDGTERDDLASYVVRQFAAFERLGLEQPARRWSVPAVDDNPLNHRRAGAPDNGAPVSCLCLISG